MKADQISTTPRAKSITLHILDELLTPEATQDVGVRLWDGTLWPDDRPRLTTIVLNHPGALRTMFASLNEVALAEAYLYDDFNVEGDLAHVFGLGDKLIEASRSLSTKLRVGKMILSLPAGGDHQEDQRGAASLSGEPHSMTRDRQAISYHYDVSNDFYSLWLDKNMVYSCAYFEEEGDDLDSAQERKLDYICRKLRLKRGQKLLDIGCGWGGLLRHAAGKYGVQALGITLSEPQVELANQRLAEAGLAEQARVQLLDYREVEGEGSYDALVSVGMFEHVGAALLGTYFRKAMELLRPGGVFLNHGIASNATIKRSKGPSFTQRYVFPDGELTPINISLHEAEEAGFEVRDVESLREHYAITLRHWVRRLEAAHEEALKFVAEPTYRVWRLFMSASAYGFSIGNLNVYQSLLVKQAGDDSSNLPLTRADWYA